MGAVNAAYMAASEHLPADEAGEGGLERWREVSKGTVIRPILLRQAPLTALRYAGRDPLACPGCGCRACSTRSRSSATSTAGSTGTPSTATSTTDVVDVVGTVATAARTGRTVVFVEGHTERDHAPLARDRLRRRRGSTTSTCARRRRSRSCSRRCGSSSPREARGWYFDGGTRLNTPIKPALDLGAERLVVIGDGLGRRALEPARPPRHAEPPDFGDGALHVLQGMLVDPVVEDMRILGNINMFFADAATAARSERRGRPGRRATDGRDRALPRGARQAALPLHPLHLHRAREAGRDRPPGDARCSATATAA